MTRAEKFKMGSFILFWVLIVSAAPAYMIFNGPAFIVDCIGNCYGG
jgi:hypothetical protein